VVEHAGRSPSAPGLGYYVRIRHADGDRSIYAHLLWTSVAPGQRVGWGQQIAVSGMSSFWLDGPVWKRHEIGPHLHFHIFSAAGAAVGPPGAYSQPASAAIRAASTRLRAPNLVTADAR
jgi:murein DD-endopeptidase MepM/ murein hydrolase activator NlpD